MSIEPLDCLKRERDIYISRYSAAEKRRSGVSWPYN